MVSRYESQSILRCFICICLSEFCISVFFLLSYDTLESALDPGLCLSIFQVIGGQLRCLIGKWWNNCTQLSSAVLYSITNDRIIAPYSIAIYSLLPHHTLYCCIILYSTILSIANDRIIVALNTTILYLALQCVLSCVSLRIPPYFLYCIAMYHRFILRSILHNYIWTICMCLHVWMSAEYQIVEVILRHSLWDVLAWKLHLSPKILLWCVLKYIAKPNPAVKRYTNCIVSTDQGVLQQNHTHQFNWLTTNKGCTDLQLTLTHSPVRFIAPCWYIALFSSCTVVALDIVELSTSCTTVVCGGQCPGWAWAPPDG